ncbi:MAG: fatty acid hydroxylase [Erythrobacteraceae bacterium]|nr:fatty acid hydroxylase [Erythrobacteraceae bacterium]|tara:strand:- start:790 stop:1632 length:843 start_codon:yes stop_codon:yes gene_type:complete
MEFFGLDEGAIRLSVFAGIFATMALAETLFARKTRTQKRTSRWFTNWALVVIDTAVLRIIFPVLAVGVSVYAQQKGWGLFNVIALPTWLEIMIAIALLDMAVWAQHVATHKIPLLWRFHKVHHVDRDIDVTTGVRFHPVEIVLSMAYKLVLVLAIGPAALAVFLFEVILNASAMFNHSNVKLPNGMDRALRAIMVTPDMHRVHHSIIMRETDSNYGFFLSFWDRLFHTYIAQPEKGHDGMVIGLEEHQDDAPSSLIWSLMLPFKDSAAANEAVLAQEKTQ